MTVRDRLIKILASKGVPDHQAEEILESSATEVDKFLSGYSVNWNDSESDLAFIAYSKIWHEILREKGLKWIRKNNQYAPYRKNFEGGS